MDERGIPSLEYGDWHTHADLRNIEEDFFTFIEAILEDRQLFLVIDTLAPGSRWAVLEETFDQEMTDALTDPRAADRVRMVSWTGTKDRVVRLEDLQSSC